MLSILYYIWLAAICTVVLVLSVAVLALTYPFQKSRRIVHEMSRYLALSFLLPFPRRVEGLENVDRRERYVIVLNHQAMVDIGALYHVPLNFRWVSKREVFRIPFFGLYGACSTMAEALCLAALCAAAGYAHEILAMSSSHFCAAERQFRTPLEYGGKRTPTAQWTATAAGACLVRGSGAAGVPVLSATIGRVCDAGVKDINNMGAAMAPAAAQTLLHYFADTGTTQQDFDAIFTGDLGEVGSTLLHELMHKADCPVENHQDCGCLLYDVAAQNVQAGGSGAGCSAAVLAAHVLPGLVERRWRRVLFLSTGALMSQTTFLQKESIPAVAHLVELTAPEKES